MEWPICFPVAGFSWSALGSSGRQSAWGLGGLRPGFLTSPVKAQLLSEGLCVIDVLIKIADIK